MQRPFSCRGTILNGRRVRFGHIQRKDYFYFAFVAACGPSKRIFTRGVVEKNCICSAAFCESASLRKSAADLRPHPALRATFPRLGEGNPLSHA